MATESKAPPENGDSTTSPNLHLAGQLLGLQRRFGTAADILVANLDDHAATAEVRDAMDLAGRLLIRLVTKGVVCQPPPDHSWLHFSTLRFPGRGRFTTIRYASGMTGMWGTPKPLREVIYGVTSFWSQLGQVIPLRDREVAVGPTRHRLIFLEALAGWLADQVPGCRRIETPTVVVEVQVAGSLGPKPICLTSEWSDQEGRHRALHLDAARAGAQVCRHLRMLVQQSTFEADIAEAPSLRARVHAPVTETPGRTLHGWVEILPAVGLDATSRKHKDMVKRVNRESQGPIVKVRGKSVIADEAKLLSWWNNVIGRARAACDHQPDLSRVGASEMESPGARIERKRPS